MKKIVGILVLFLVVIAAVVFARALSLHSQHHAGSPAVLPPVNASAVGERLAAALRFQTISNQDNSLRDSSQFTAFHQHLEQTYPAFHSAVEKESVAGLSLLFRWRGKNNTLKPALLMSHQDVVPVEPGTEKLWKSPPFAGNTVNGEIYGRGAIDDKCGLVGIFEAVELLLRENYVPQRTLYFAFGHDEEVGGRGAAATAALLKSRGIEIESVLDEGTAILESDFAGVSKPKALIGIAEKGYLTLELSAITDGGHSSMPPENTAVGILSAAIVNLEKNPMPARLEGPLLQTFESLAPEMPISHRLLFTNLWLFRPLIISTLKGSPSGNAMIRTTTAPTMLQGSPKENILAREARATINFRILPGDSIESVMQHVRKVVDDQRITIKKGNAFEPSPVSSSTSQAYTILAKTINSVFSEAIPVPFLVLGGTDARHFTSVSRNVYRFLPVQLSEKDLSMVHGTNERIGVAAYAKAIQFYYAYLKMVSQ